MIWSGWAWMIGFGVATQAMPGAGTTGGMGRPKSAISIVSAICDPYWIVEPAILMSLTVNVTPASIHACGIWKTAWRMKEPVKGALVIGSVMVSKPRTICQQSEAFAPAGSLGSA